jgi:hypothetical protein
MTAAYDWRLGEHGAEYLEGLKPGFVFRVSTDDRGAKVEIWLPSATPRAPDSTHRFASFGAAQAWAEARALQLWAFAAEGS